MWGGGRVFSYGELCETVGVSYKLAITDELALFSTSKNVSIYLKAVGGRSSVVGRRLKLGLN